MILNEKIKNKLWGVFAIVIVAAFVIWMLINPAPQHIEDTNGADNYSLQQITKQDVVANKIGSRGGPNTKETRITLSIGEMSSGIKYYSRKFTGVYVLHTTTIFKGSDIYLNLSDFQINDGNFAFYVVLDGEIIGEVKPDEFNTAEFLVENVNKTGSLEYIIAGESANFKFTTTTEW